MLPYGHDRDDVRPDAPAGNRAWEAVERQRKENLEGPWADITEWPWSTSGAASGRTSPRLKTRSSTRLVTHAPLARSSRASTSRAS
ncbi:putative predicted protein [Rhizobium favelukesii]|uniref:Uncharacterized protein n=1 Tax=Rhizobium favelukesii TaxID=348824 RepID=W6RAY5_9HYPH|nr:putative predicted protein [Rhizobium favelukesii]